MSVPATLRRRIQGVTAAAQTIGHRLKRKAKPAPLIPKDGRRPIAAAKDLLGRFKTRPKKPRGPVAKAQLVFVRIKRWCAQQGTPRRRN
ncbi:hypothetical protein ABN028_32920 [Actinopolymorpha sp. B17G11]|uniref:hypothetical protein n=1 Tax=Actinopolymorpha sp. B17G11 TaxID=3160861 RepID=UPI0032E4FEBB